MAQRIGFSSSLRKRCAAMNGLISSVAAEIYPSREAMHEFGYSQLAQAEILMSWAISFMERNPESSAQAMGMVRRWASQDISEESRDLCSDGFFPCIIKDRVKNEFPVLKPAAVLTSHGVDVLLSLGSTPRDENMYLEFLKEKLIDERAKNVGWDGSEKPPAPFVGLYDESPKRSSVYRDICFVRGVGLRLSPEVNPQELRREGYTALKGVGLVASEAWHIRVKEVHRNLPYPLLAMMSATVLQWNHRKLSDVEIKGHGGIAMLTGILYMACEWHASTWTQRARKPKDADSVSSMSADALKILKAWKDGKPCAASQWVQEWSAGPHGGYKYVSSEDVGFPPQRDEMGIMAYCREQLMIQVSKTDASTKVVENKLPFVERKAKLGDGSQLLFQTSTLTTMAYLRTFCCFTASLQMLGSTHLAHVPDLYWAALGVIGEKPTRVVKKVTKAAFQALRLLLTHFKVLVPSRPPMENSTEPFQPEEVYRTVIDTVAIAMLKNTFDLAKDASDDVLIDAVCNKHPGLFDALKKVVTTYRGTLGEEHPYPVGPYNRHYLHVASHLQALGAFAGFSASCLAAVPAAYKSTAWKKYVAKIPDPSMPGAAVNEYEMESYEQVMLRVKPPDVKELLNIGSAIAKSTSAGGDSLKLKVQKGILTDVEDDDTGESISLRSKDIVPFIGTRWLDPRLLDEVGTTSRPLTFTARNVAGGKDTRMAYMVSVTLQLLIYPFYEAMKSWMDHVNETGDERNLRNTFLLKAADGAPVHDSFTQITSSIDCVLNEDDFSFAHDASTLDQMLAERYFQTWARAAVKFLASSEAQEEKGLEDQTGYTYRVGLVKAIMRLGSSWYKWEFPGRAPQLTQITSQPSGVMTTAVGNSLATSAMMSLIRDRLTHLGKATRINVWGDDVQEHVRLVPPPAGSEKSLADIGVEYARGAQKLAFDEAGQELKTEDDSISGKVAHMLQRGFIGGQKFARPIAVDSETPTVNDGPGNIGSLIDKVTEIGRRGGNVMAVNQMVITLASLSTVFAIYGKRVILQPETVISPGGTCNRSFLGFPNSNSKLWMQLNHFAFTGSNEPIKLDARVKLEDPRELGARIVRAYGQKPVVQTINGMSESTNVTVLESNAVNALNDERLASSQSALAVLVDPVTQGYKKHAFRYSPSRKLDEAIGRTVQKGRWRQTMLDRALVGNGLVASRRGSVLDPELRKTVMSSIHTGTDVYVGGVTRRLVYRLSSDVLLTLPENYSNDYYQLLVSGTTRTRYKRRWHPFWCDPAPTNYTMGFLGMMTAPKKQCPLFPSSVKSVFDPKFRTDMTPELVMNTIQEIRKNKGDVTGYLRMVGFKDSEITKIQVAIPRIPMMFNLDEHSEYSSMPDPLKSGATDRLIEILEVTSQGVLSALDPQVQSMVLRHAAALISEEINAITSLTDPPWTIRLPRLSLTDRV